MRVVYSPMTPMAVRMVSGEIMVAAVFGRLKTVERSSGWLPLLYDEDREREMRVTTHVY